MAAENRPANQGDSKQLDLEFAREFLDVTRKDMELRTQELALRKDQQSQSHELSMAAIREQGVDRREDRVHRRAVSRQYLVFAGIVMVLLLGFALCAMNLGKETIVLESLKILGPFVGGLGAGAFFGYRKGQKDSTLPAAEEME